MSYNATESPAGKRIAALLDEGSFVEIGGSITARATDFNMQAKAAPSDGVLTGYGSIDGNLVYVYSQDASVLGGSIGEMHAKKIAAVYDMAMKMGAPVIGMLDCAGLRLEEGTDALLGLGSLYAKQALASGVIPQISAVFGTCGGGLALVPGLTDFTFMETEKARLFVNSPNALAENTAAKCDTATAAYQSGHTGLVHGTGTQEEILDAIRHLVCILPLNNEDDMSYEECTDDLNRLVEDIENAAPDAALALSMLSDNGELVELKSAYAPELVTAFIRVNGMTVGAVANRTSVFDEEGSVKETFPARLTANGCKKAADFIRFCDAFSIPVLTLTDTEGFEATKESESEIAREAAKLTYAFAEATVPKVNLITGRAFGSAAVVMNSKSLGADLTFAWPRTAIGMMDASMAAKIICADGTAEEQRDAKDRYASLQDSPEAAAKRGYIDAVIEPAASRKHIIGAFEMLFTKREDRPDKKHGTV